MTAIKRRSPRDSGDKEVKPVVRRRPTERPIRPALPDIQVAPLGEMRDFWGRKLPRPIAPGRIRTALEKHFSQWPNLLSQSLDQLYKRPAPVSELDEVKVRLFQEGDFQYIFRVSVRRRTGNLLHLAMVVSKDGAKTSKIARGELENLHLLYQREPQFVVQPLQGGMLSVDPSAPPGRAKVFAYFTPWLTTLHELGVDRRLNFYINELPFHTFRPAASDIIRGKLLSILFGYWDPTSQKAMAPPQIASGDFVISRPHNSKPMRLCLIACRKILSAISLADCLRLYLGYQGEWANQVFHFLPKEPQLLYEALHQGLVVKNNGIIAWEHVEQELKNYVEELARKPADSSEWSPLPALRRLLGALPKLKAASRPTSK
ncbi:MAG: hypothetical protein M0036_10375 [Desulfobacteraceae bacterium]|nr:hypothetical protein [Desulfobacteraceae bacterium]